MIHFTMVSSTDIYATTINIRKFVKFPLFFPWKAIRQKLLFGNSPLSVRTIRMYQLKKTSRVLFGIKVLTFYVAILTNRATFKGRLRLARVQLLLKVME